MGNKNNYLFIEYDKKNSMLSAEWIPAIVGFEEMKIEMMRMLEIIKQSKPDKVLVDTRHFKLRSNEEVQYWINFKFMPMVINEGIDKYAIVVTENVYKELKVEEDDDPIDLSEFMTVRYFTEGKVAEAWLKE